MESVARTDSSKVCSKGTPRWGAYLTPPALISQIGRINRAFPNQKFKEVLIWKRMK